MKIPTRESSDTPQISVSSSFSPPLEIDTVSKIEAHTDECLLS
jgi:hypothetical protein